MLFTDIFDTSPQSPKSLKLLIFSMPQNVVREQLDHLWDVIVLNPEINIPTEPDQLNDITAAELNAHNIIYTIWDPKTFNDEESSLQQRPPILFCPLPAQVCWEIII